MNIVILDGHPDGGQSDRVRLVAHLLDVYQRALPSDATVTRINVRDLSFSPNLGRGYANVQTWEPDLARVANAIADCDHLVVGFPLWWGAEPAILKGLLDRILLPGFAFKYHRDNPFWDRLLMGRSADLIITMDTPPWYLRLFYGDSVVRRWRSQILGFCGFKPMRAFRLGPTRRGAAAKSLTGWERELTHAARTVAKLARGAKVVPEISPQQVTEALKDRMS